MHRKAFLDWSVVDELAELLAHRIKRQALHPIHRIMGVPRGGLIPAVMVAHHLQLEDVRSHLPSSISGMGILVVDDICDSGKTLAGIRNQYPGAVTASLIRRSTSVVVPDFVGQEITHTDWVVFPWETNPDKDMGEYAARNR